MPLPITILRQYHQSELGPGGEVVRLVRVDFRVGADGPFNVSIPEPEFTADTLAAKVQAVADQVGMLRDRLAPPK
jgi:hypothetical protein